MESITINMLQLSVAQSRDNESAIDKESGLTMPVDISRIRSSVVYFVRHAESESKPWVNGEFKVDMAIVDPKLTARGQTQCTGVSQYLSVSPTFDLTHIMSSPMSRAMDTATGMFGWKINGGVKFMAIADLQTLSQGPTGMGLSAWELGLRYGMSTVGSLPQDWNDVKHKSESNGRYSDAARNVEVLQDLLEKLRAESISGYVAVAVVAHSSFLRYCVAREGWITYEIRPEVFNRHDEGYPIHNGQDHVLRFVPHGNTVL